MRFYYRFLANRQTQLALGIQDQALEEIKRHLRDFIGANTWEELCREWLLRASANHSLPYWSIRWEEWTCAPQVDVVGINSHGEAPGAWRVQVGRRTPGRSILTTLVDKTPEVVPDQGQWEVYHLGFARDGWTTASHSFAQDLAAIQPAGKNWRVTGMRLLDLAQVDQDLTAWVGH